MTEDLREKRTRLRTLLASQWRASQVPKIEPRETRSELEPLSFAQEGLWFVSRLEGPNPAYNLPVVVRLSGPLDVAALNRAITTLIQRHEALRTRFTDGGGVPYRTVSEAEPVRLEPRRVSPEEAEDVYREWTRRPFDVSAEPLFRVALFEESEERFVLLASMHHTVSDAWSVGVFLRELVSLYDSFVQGVPAALEPLPVGYGDYVEWERRWLASGVLERQLEYWKGRLQGLRPVLPLPTDRPRPSVLSSHGGTVEIPFPPGLLEELKVLCAREICSLFVALAAALSVLLHRYSGERDLAIGTGVARRRLPELEGLIGYFVNTLVLRIPVDPEEDFATLLRATRELVLEALDHQDAPYHQVVEHLHPQRASTHAPFVQVMLTLQNVPYKRRIDLPSLAIDAEVPESGAAKFDLSIAIQEEVGCLRGQIEYRADLFDSATARRLAGHYVRLVQGLVADPGAPVSRHELLGDEERRTLTETWSGRDRVRTAGRSVPALFEEQVRERPAAVALVDGDRFLSYDELERRANRLAGHLRTLGVADEAVVGICLERSAEAVIAVLAVLEAGGAYLPLDADNPVERTRTMIETAETELVLSTSSLAHGLPVAAERLVLLDRLPAPLGRCGDGPPAAVAESALAYVMFTSGSTGEPKGVAVEHRSITRLVRDADWIELDEETVTLQHSPASFDASTFEIWAPLLNGGTLVLRKEDAADVEGLAAQVERERVDTLWLTAGVLPLWVGEHLKRKLALRYLLTGGDVVPEKAVREIQADDPEVVVINGYGPTENTTFSCCYRIPPEPAANGSVPIGTPIAGSTAYVFDDRLRLQPIGVPGQLFVGGAGVARGYVNRPDLTAGRFLSDPFSPDPEGRLYRTGDQVRWLASGVLEFLGRTDNQVKVRGFRIELEEVELHLAQLPQVELAAVVVRDDPGPGKRLVAYVVARDATAARAGETAEEARVRRIAELRVFLRSRLPEYMVPSLFVLCDRLPLTPNGKVDRRALPDPRAEDLQRAAYRPPRDATERVLCEVWQEVLRVDRVGLDDDFFDLGGHSLLATQLVVKVRDRLDRDLQLSRLFQTPTVAGVAHFLGGDNRQRGVDRLAALVPDAERKHEPFPMTGVQQAYCFGRYGAFELGNVSTHAYVEMDLVDLDVARLERAWNALIARHDMLRAVFSQDGSQRILAKVPTYELACDDLRVLAPEMREERLAETRERMSHQIFPVEDWPLFEVRATRLSERRFRLHFSLDALLSDASSAMIIVRELDRIYEDPEAPLPELTISFRDYVLALGRIRESPLYERSRAYWDARAPELPPAPELPLAQDPAQITRPRFKRRYSVLEPERWRAFQELARASGITPSVLLVAVFSRVLDRWSKTGHFTLNLTLFNRLPLHEQVDSLVGDFTSLTLLEIEASAPQALAALGRVIQERLWADMEHRYFEGIEVLRSLSRRSRGGRPTLMPVVFTSALGLGERDDAPPGLLTRALADPWAAENFGITQTSQVWLDNVVSEAQGALTITWDALEELFPAGVLDAMFEAYRSLLNRLASGELSPEDPCRVLLPAEQEAVRRAVNDTSGWTAGGLLQDGFRDQVRRRPNQPAVIAGDVVLDYATLDLLARGVAAELRAREAAPNELVAVVLDKGWEQIAAVMGVLYAGAAYLPIGAGLPPERVALLLEQGQARLVVTRPGLEPQAPWPAGVEVLTVDGVDARCEGTGDDPPSPAEPGDLAYVIFTSGSTGVPKGVMIDHRGAVNTVADVNRRFSVGPGDRVLGLSSMSFDLSVYDVFGVLGAGGTLVLPEPRREKDAAHWVELVERHEVTLWNTVPTLAQLYVEEVVRSGRRGAASTIRLVLMSGDWIPLQLPDRWREVCLDPVVVSLGGATEASIWSIFHVIGELGGDWISVPYGRPLANQRFHVLAGDLSPCPDWVVGELFIGGDGLAQGYWRDEEKTLRSFFRHPVTGERLYRTGDHGRYRPDGTIEFLGREDSQVKVFGHRIELGEIEAVLCRHERIAAAAVTVTGEGRDRRLVAYVVPKGQVEQEESAELIADPARQAAFKLEQRGLRRFPAGTPSVPLAAPEAPAGPDGFEVRLTVGPGLRRRSERARASLAAGPLTGEVWGRWLSRLAEQPVEGHPIPKRDYPSAGSLYPVQVYCHVRAGAIEGVEAGFHYCDPSNHGLVWLGPKADPGTWSVAGRSGEPAFVLMAVAARNAIVPIYGSLADRLSLLEAGHLIELLASAAESHGVAFPIRVEAGDGVLREALGLSVDHRILGCWAGGAAAAPGSSQARPFPILARQSYREFLGGPVAAGRLVELLAASPDDGIAVYLHLAPGATDGGAPGFQAFDRETARLLPVADPDEELLAAAHAPANRELHARSSFSLFLVAEPGDEESLIAAGSLGQALMHLAPTLGLGLCPVGYLETSGIRERLGLGESAAILYSFEGGAITEEQTRSWPVEDAGAAANELEALRAYLRERLPGYMVPSVFVPLSRLPLTRNGKLDREALPEVAEDSDGASVFLAPRNEIEKRIADKWTEILNVERLGVHDNFFDLGGNSLSATRIVSALWSEFSGDGGRVSIETFFENPTVAAVAELVALGREARLLEENQTRIALEPEWVEEGEI